MKVLHGVRITARSGLELCAVACKCTGEVLVEESAGQVLSHEIIVWDADVVKRDGRQ